MFQAYKLHMETVQEKSCDSGSQPESVRRIKSSLLYERQSESDKGPAKNLLTATCAELLLSYNRNLPQNKRYDLLEKICCMLSILAGYDNEITFTILDIIENIFWHFHSEQKIAEATDYVTKLGYASKCIQNTHYRKTYYESGLC